MLESDIVKIVISSGEGEEWNQIWQQGASLVFQTLSNKALSKVNVGFDVAVWELAS